ncbi:hypothetical protein HPB51_027750 [Rhipicephalus microplus]|uniref:Uncharacterized protein n=1 Tax=Rhipicephalus microplus TaxID=6941 RepID=A0A9J6CZE2_RHIMP|nr:hypothetical protein HPB51_027750 [Rhipicephalus microplus]
MSAPLFLHVCGAKIAKRRQKVYNSRTSASPEPVDTKLEKQRNDTPSPEGRARDQDLHRPVDLHLNLTPENRGHDANPDPSLGPQHGHPLQETLSSSQPVLKPEPRPRHHKEHNAWSQGQSPSWIPGIEQCPDDVSEFSGSDVQPRTASKAAMPRTMMIVMMISGRVAQPTAADWSRVRRWMGRSLRGEQTADAGRDEGFSCPPPGYRFLLPTLATGEGMQLCVFLHGDPSKRPYQIEDFREPLKEAGVLKAVSGIGEALQKALSEFGEVKDVRLDEWSVPGFQFAESTTRYVRMVLNEGVPVKELPHLFNFYNGSVPSLCLDERQFA